MSKKPTPAVGSKQPPQEHEMTEEEKAKVAEIEEETRQVKAQTDQTYDDTVDTTFRMLKTVTETRDVGAATMADLKAQGEQLSRIEGKVDKVEANMEEADKQLTVLERWFCCCFARDSGKKIRLTEETRQRREEEQRQAAAAAKAKAAGGDGSAPGTPTRDPPVSDADELMEGRGRRERRADRERNRDPNRDARNDVIDNNLEEVGDIVGDLKEQARAMAGELAVQDEQLDRIQGKVDKNNQHVQVATKRAANVNTSLFAF